MTKMNQSPNAEISSAQRAADLQDAWHYAMLLVDRDRSTFSGDGWYTDQLRTKKGREKMLRRARDRFRPRFSFVPHHSIEEKARQLVAEINEEAISIGFSAYTARRLSDDALEVESCCQEMGATERQTKLALEAAAKRRGETFVAKVDAEIDAVAEKKIRVRVASARARGAMEDITEAIDRIYAAARDLSSLIGANEEHRLLCRTATALRDLRHQLDVRSYDGNGEDAYELDRDPTAEELTAVSSGAHPDEIVLHGCGKGR